MLAIQSLHVPEMWRLPYQPGRAQTAKMVAGALQTAALRLLSSPCLLRLLVVRREQRTLLGGGQVQ